MDVAKQKRRKPPAPPARRKNNTGVLSDMTSFFWNQLEACWEDPSMRPKIHMIVVNLQILANRFTPTQSEQIENPPPYAPPVDKATLNYASSVSIPTQLSVPIKFFSSSAANITAIEENTVSRSPLGLPPASQTGRSDEKKSNTPLASLPTKVQMYSSSGPTVTPGQTPDSKASARQRGARPYQNPSASESNAEQSGKFPVHLMCYMTEFAEDR
jgi:hypothetical protein